jgi:tetratricopeptide (TPR) repeat protein
VALAADERDQWRHADRLFAELVELAPARRAQRLAALPVPAPVRAKLERLLHSCERSCDWLDRDGGWTATVPATADAQPDGTAPGATALAGRRLGAWRIESELGRGGMAVVYRARRVDGAADQVAALKLLSLGGLDHDGGERFRRETDILARLNHPNIVSLLDAGIADDGTPWLAMPLIEGTRIDQWCQQARAGTRAVVELLLQVCAAVASAHRNLVIHRDLKPSNVLVDGDGRVRLLDFGIARLDLGDTEATATRWRALTPDYAAPEQLRGEPPSTAIDIHGLGALAYRLLAGRPPRRPDPDQAVTLPSQAAAQQPDWPPGHRQALRGDLDRVLMKALAAEPGQRYGTVEALADDLRRWLAGHPVQARAASHGYRLRRFVGRHRVGVAACLALFALLLAGVAATLWQAERARREAERAVAVRDLLVDMLRAADPTVAVGADPPASELLRRGAIQVRERLADRPALLAELLLVIGHSQLNRARLDEARQSLDEALALHRSGAVDDPAGHAQALYLRAQLAYELGQTSDGIELARRGVDLALDAGAGELHEGLQVRLADLLTRARRLDEAQALAAGLVERIDAADRQPRPDAYYRALLVLGTVAEIRGEQDQAVARLEQAAVGFRDRPDAIRTLANIENTLGVAHLNGGRYEQAEQRLRSALAAQVRLFGSEHPDPLVTRGNLAGVLMYSGRAAEAAREFEAILGPQRALAGGQPHPDVAVVLGYLARAHYLAGDTVAALAAAQASRAELAGIADADRAGLDWIVPLAGLLLFELQRPDPERLLDDPGIGCGDAGTGGSTARWVCLARALAHADEGRCAPAATPADAPAPAPGPGDGIERRWQAVHWLLRARCAPTATAAAAAAAAIERLRPGAQPPFPDWLERRLHAQFGDAGPKPFPAGSPPDP